MNTKKLTKDNVDSGTLKLNIPRDRKSDYEPRLILRGKTTISGIDDKIISLYAGGMSLRDMEKQIKEMYDVEMSDTLLSRIIDRITPEINEWQNPRAYLSDSIYGRYDVQSERR